MNRRAAPVAQPAIPFSGDASALIDRFAACLIRQAARHAPLALSERLQEEWLASLMERHGQLSRLRFAIGCSWATRVIAREFPAPKLAGARIGGGQRTLNLLALPDLSFLSRRMVALLLIACLHAGLLYLLANGLVYRVITAIPQSIQATVFPEQRVHEVPPPPPRPNLTLPQVELPRPDFPLEAPAASDTISQVLPEQPPHSGSSQELLQAVNRVLGGPGPGFPNTDEYYPAASIRLDEKGVATLRVCVDRNGRLSAEPTLAQSSGSARLDQGAVRLAKAGSGHYRVTTENGRSVDYCYPLRVRFELRH